MKILVVDNKKEQRKQIGKFLKEHGHNVVFATNGDTAKTRIRQYWLNLVITATSMPFASGPEVAMFTQTRRKRRRPVVIGMSDNKEDREFYEYFWQTNEPMEKLLEIIKKVCAKSS